MAYLSKLFSPGIAGAFAVSIGVFLAVSFLAFSFLAFSGPAHAAEEYLLVIKDHKFEPAELHVPAGKKIKLRVRNDDKTIEEFESHSLNREKLIMGGRTVTIWVGPLKPGSYDFFGEFHMDTALGILIAE